MGFQTSLGVELTDRRMILVCLKTSLKGVKLAAHAVYPLDPDQPAREQLSRISDGVREFTREKRISPTNIHLGVSGRLAVLKEIEFPLAVKENLGRTLGYELDKYAPLPVEEIHHDHQVVEEDAGANRLKVMFAMIRKKEIDGRAELGKMLGAGVSGIEIHTTALANFVAHRAPGDSRKIVGAIHLGAEVRDLLLLNNRRLRCARSLPAEGDPADLLRGLTKMYGAGEAGPDEAEERPAALVFGPGADREVLERLRAENAFDIVPLALADAGLPDWELAPGYGLALKGLGMAPTEINFLPRQYRKRPSRLGLYFMIFLIFLVIGSGLAWGGSRLMKQRMRHDRLDAEIERLEAKASDLEGIMADVDAARERLEYLNGLSGGRLELLDQLRELTMLIPETAWVRDFTFTDKGVKLDGFADSAAELIPLLEASPNFTEVGFLSAITKGKDGMERFRIGLKVK